MKTAEPGGSGGGTAVVGTCANCGEPLTKVGMDGECLRCLLSLGFLDASHPEQSQAHRRLTPEPLKYDHFEVEVGADGFPIELGAGAAAITYRARDTVLNSVVALKVIDRKIAQIPGVRSRFLREARAAAQIRHPNVARVSHYGEKDGECFYVMELVEGETLDARIRRDGPMPLTLALEVIEQVARALVAAETCGIVHRDIKPSNIMLEADASGCLLVKVIDYGIAKIDNGEVGSGAEPTQSGFVGTPAFASPEQFVSAEQAKIDARSDIYSLGVTFWFLLSGRKPFLGRTLDEIRKRQSEPLPIEQLKGSHVPARILELLKSMLAHDPNDRPQSARELLTAVHRCYLRFSDEARMRRRRIARTAIVGALTVVAIALGFLLYRETLNSATVDRSIAVLPFENLSPQGEDAYFAIGMQDEITGDLAKLAGMKVIGSQSTRSYTPGAERNLRAIGRDLGVRHLLEGTVYRDKEHMRIALHLVDLQDASHPWNETYQQPTKEIFDLQIEITRAIAARLNARLSPNETAALERSPTSDLAAYDLYLRAQALSRVVNDSAELASIMEQRVSLLKEAVSRDPKFALAYCGLAEAYDVLHQSKHLMPADKRHIDFRALAEIALEKARRVAPDFGPLHLALADHFVVALNDVEQGRLEIDIARQTMPNSAALERTAGVIARRQARWDDAVRTLERAVALEPRGTENIFTLANTYRLMRRYDRFDGLMARLLAILPPNRLATYRVFRTFGPLERLGDLGPLREATATVKPEEDPSGAIRDLHNLILALWSHDPDSISRISAAAAETTFAFNGVKYPKGWYEGLAGRLRGDKECARTAFSAAREKGSPRS